MANDSDTLVVDVDLVVVGGQPIVTVAGAANGVGCAGTPAAAQLQNWARMTARNAAGYNHLAIIAGQTQAEVLWCL